MRLVPGEGRSLQFKKFAEEASAEQLRQETSVEYKKLISVQLLRVCVCVCVCSKFIYT